MARRKPDITEHMKALRWPLAVKVEGLRLIHARGYRPQTLHLHAADYDAIIGDLRGAGFDVARGVVFRGIPVKTFDAC